MNVIKLAIYFEIFILILQILLISIELIISINLNNSYVLMRQSFFYNSIVAHTDSINLHYNFKSANYSLINNNFTCDDNLSVYYFTNFDSINYLTKVDNDFYFNKSSGEYILDSKLQLSNWYTNAICYDSYPSIKFRFYFIKNGLDCSAGHYNCRNNSKYNYNYTVCLEVLDSSIKNNTGTGCPFNDISIESGNDDTYIQVFQSFLMKTNLTVSNSYQNDYIGFRLGIEDSSKIILPNLYVDSIYQNLNTVFDRFSNNISIYDLNRLDLYGNYDLISIYDGLIESIDSIKFFQDYSNKYGNLDNILGSINFDDQPTQTIGLKVLWIVLPSQYCVTKYFVNNTYYNQIGYFETLRKLTFEFLSLNITIYLVWNVVELIYNLIFSLLLRLLILIDKINDNIREIDKNSQSVSFISSIIFNTLIYLFKLIPVVDNYQKLMERDNIYNFIINDNCFKNYDDDNYNGNSPFHVSLITFYESFIYKKLKDLVLTAVIMTNLRFGLDLISYLVRGILILKEKKLKYNIEFANLNLDNKKNK